jgi:hypothetical protein
MNEHGTTAREKRGALHFINTPYQTVEQFPTVDLAFAWTQDKYAPLILGQMNFFLAFDVCFYGYDLAFEISQK